MTAGYQKSCVACRILIFLGGLLGAASGSSVFPEVDVLRNFKRCNRARCFRILKVSTITASTPLSRT